MSMLLSFISLPLFAFAGAFAVMAVTGRAMIAWLKNLKGMKWSAREDTPDTHLQKAGTPSMGGLGIVFAALMGYSAVVIFTVFLLSRISGSLVSLFDSFYVLSLVLLPSITIAHLVLGWVDDWSKATGRGGLRARAKFASQVGLAVIFLCSFYWLTTNPSVKSDFLFNLQNPMLLVMVFGILLLVILATGNAVNITDGIDGLASGVGIQSFVALWIAGSYSASIWTYEWLMALAGGCAGFLIFNKHKAQVFMGDTGSLALGAALGAAAILTRTVFLLPFIGFIFYVEMFSVMAQVLWFKYTRKKYGEGRRIFRRAPLHHHYELGGWSEWRVVLTFWAVNAVATIIGLGLWSAGILPRFP